MSSKRTDAIVLKAQSLRERDQIVTLFSKEFGIINCVFKGFRASSQKNSGPCGPLTRAEFILSGRNPDLMSCGEISILSHYLEIRKHLGRLESACQMLQAVKKTQLPGKPAPLLYVLLVKYLEALSETSHPETLAESFFLKLFRHEGRLGHLGICSVCNAPLERLFLSHGEGFCALHAKAGSLVFESGELHTALVLLYSQKIGEISTIFLPPSLRDKLKTFFGQLLYH